MRKPLVIGNWKMFGNRRENEVRLAAIVAGTHSLAVDMAICAPFPYLAQLQDELSGSHVVLGAQNVSTFVSGPYTGEVAPAMLADFDCRYVLVGHSERRTLFDESDAMVAAKAAALLAQGLTPVLCLGETLAERELGCTESVVARQLDAVIAVTGVSALASMVIAYEPVWAIGTGRSASVEQAQAVHAFIRRHVAQKDTSMSSELAAGLRILYGGSVKASNAAALFAMPDIDGGLIGGASLIADEFAGICFAARYDHGNCTLASEPSLMRQA
ncbi:MAG: triose-phosphate isomerase [Dechloromonas sp.]|nr:triose-phosphate isomerase [Dechloromonas sp.]